MATPQAISLRKKKLGVLIMDARMVAGRTQEECAELLGISPAAFRAYEQGESSPSLPELEVLAYFLNIPLEHFWGNTAYTGNGNLNNRHEKMHRLLALRQRIVGTKLREARLANKLTLEDLAQKAGISADQLKRYELGEDTIPLPDLEILAGHLKCPLQDFHDTHGPIGDWIQERRTLAQVMDMPAELQSFVLKPINRPYLELAERLSEMSVEKLRAVAEGLLEITL